LKKVGEEEIGRRLEKFKVAVQAAGVRVTHQRLEIFREIAASPEHPGAADVFRLVRERVPTVSLDTVYRTLWLLDDLGLVAALGPRHEAVRFDANLEGHHHYVCVRCGLVRDFRSVDFDALRIPDEVNGFGSVVGAKVEVRGTCNRCAGEELGEWSPGGIRESEGHERGEGNES
jgi:Fur family transcriptional regulator, peroxide stress response regulator